MKSRDEAVQGLFEQFSGPQKPVGSWERERDLSHEEKRIRFSDDVDLFAAGWMWAEFKSENFYSYTSRTRLRYISGVILSIIGAISFYNGAMIAGWVLSLAGIFGIYAGYSESRSGRPKSWQRHGVAFRRDGAILMDRPRDKKDDLPHINELPVLVPSQFSMGDIASIQNEPTRATGGGQHIVKFSEEMVGWPAHSVVLHLHDGRKITPSFLLTDDEAQVAVIQLNLAYREMEEAISRVQRSQL